MPDDVLSRDEDGNLAFRPLADPVPGPTGLTGPPGETGATGPPADAAAMAYLDERVKTFEGILTAHDGAIVELQNRPVGGAAVGRGYSYLDEFPGTSPADKLRAAWSVPRAVVPLPGTVIDVGALPIPIPPGGVLMGLAAAQNEFSRTWPVLVRAAGGRSVFANPASGSNYGGSKGWTFSNIGFEGTGTVDLFEPNPSNASGPIFAYATIEGCSADNFRTVLDTPMLGCTIDFRYLNNLTLFGCRIGGSDNTLFPNGCKMDFGGSAAGDAKRAAVLILSSLQKSYVGPVYITGQPSTALLVEGSAGRDGVNIVGAVFEGRNAASGASGAVVRVTGGGVNFAGCSINFGMRNPAATGRADGGSVHVTGGRVMLRDCTHEPCSGVAAPFVAAPGGSVKVRDAVGVGGAALIYTGNVQAG